jgi:hypothetical protein
MKANTYSKPTITIGDKNIYDYSSFTISEPGNNQINTLKLSGLNRDLANASLVNQEVVVYLNEGSSDSAAAFRGFIKSISLKDKSLSIKAFDPRILISGKDAFPIIIDDNENFDGHTLVQMIHEYISTNINDTKVRIGLDMLQETDPKLLMRGFRTDLAVPYQIMQDSLKQALKDVDIENPIDYEMIMIDDGVKSNIVVQAKRLLTERAHVYYDLLDGVQTIKYKKAPLPNFALIKGEKNTQAKFQLGNMAGGPSGITVSGPYNNRDTAKLAGMIEVLKSQDELKDVSITVTKGYEVSIGSIINIYLNNNTNDTHDLSSNHRVVSKTISWSKNGTKMTLRLNNKPLKLSSYIF